jgi:hypothetical protein
MKVILMMDTQMIMDFRIHSQGTIIVDESGTVIL